jgi:CRISPR/Cas system CSM-associated protein Csm3 (group 7 of RAMP superfamily)
MPQRQQNEQNREPEYWNPYRWVTMGSPVTDYHQPQYHHRFSGLSGRIEGHIEPLTPLIIGDGRDPKDVHFLLRDNMPIIPATSLKGMIRSLVELVGNACVPFAKCEVDADHESNHTARAVRDGVELDVASRMFGMITQGNQNPVFAGLVRFHDAVADAEKLLPKSTWSTFVIAGGTPKPDHRAFYPPERNARKFYHHKPGDTLVPAPGNIRQTRRVTPVPAKSTTFGLQVDFENIDHSELGLLLYCLTLEESVTVSLSPEALGGGAYSQPIQLTGPMRHKLGGAKSQGAGSIAIHLERLSLFEDRTSRYRGQSVNPQLLEGDELQRYLQQETASLRQRQDRTIQELRAMLIFTPDDPRAANLRYPSHSWFRNVEGSRPMTDKTHLKPTL